jgi:hypothetical protein
MRSLKQKENIILSVMNVLKLKEDGNMGLKQEPFRKYHVNKQIDSFTIRLNSEERKSFEENKYLLQQEKDSTAMKQLAEIGAKVLHEEKVKQILELVMNNYRKNKRLGIVTFD